MKRSLLRITAYLQIALAIFMATGCAQTQPFFLNESPDLQYYLNTATEIEYPDVDVASLPDTTETLPPLSIGNHDYEFMDMTLEECVTQALQNAKFAITTGGVAEFRQNVADQFISGQASQFSSIYDVAIQQSTTQSVPLTTDSNGNRTLPRGVVRANQVGGVEDALAEFDAQVTGFVSYGTTDRPRNTGNSAVSATQARAYDATQQAAISKRTATGGSLTLREQIVYGRSNLPVNPGVGAARQVASDWTVSIEAQIQHPLMRNRGTLVNRIPVVLASLNEDITLAQYEGAIRNLVRDVENAYWDLYVGYRTVSAAIVARNSALVTARAIQLRMENGSGSQQELAQAVGQYYQFRSQLEAALSGSNLPGVERNGVYGAERRLRELTGISPTDGRFIRPIDEPTLARVEIDWDEAVCQALYLSPELRQTKYQLKQNELELISAKNQILPEVNASLLYRWVGVGDTLGPSDRNGQNFPAAGSSALAELTEGNYQELVARLDISPTAIGARRELARINGARFRIAQNKAFLVEKERLLVSRLSDAVASVPADYQQVQSIAQRWQSAEIEVKAQMAAYELGRSTVNVVLQSQQRRAQATADYYRALAEYNKTLNYVDYLKGTLLKNSNITLAEGPWNKKAYWDALERARERSAGRKLQYGVSRPNVQRRGPVLDGDFAGQTIGSGVPSHGELMPPEGIILEGPNGQSVLLSDEEFRDAVEVESRPLSTLGDSTGDILRIDNGIQEYIPNAPTESMQNAMPMAPQGVTPPQNLQPQEVQPMVQPISYERRVGDLDSVETEYAPAPVRRRAIPQN